MWLGQKPLPDYVRKLKRPQELLLDLLDIPMIMPIPMSAWFACRNHIDEKSPREQPMRQRNVLIAARFHKCREPQNSSIDSVFSGVTDGLPELPHVCAGRIKPGYTVDLDK